MCRLCRVFARLTDSDRLDGPFSPCSVLMHQSIHTETDKHGRVTSGQSRVSARTKLNVNVEVAIDDVYAACRSQHLDGLQVLLDAHQEHRYLVADLSAECRPKCVDTGGDFGHKSVKTGDEFGAVRALLSGGLGGLDKAALLEFADRLAHFVDGQPGGFLALFLVHVLASSGVMVLLLGVWLDVFGFTLDLESRQELLKLLLEGIDRAATAICCPTLIDHLCRISSRVRGGGGQQEERGQ
mmetsp:Transcript_16487/g.39584  ORF Transcript_16487/g.39584 Transcript_16487/m.39584 type:complete len:240 (+) Transcript_16487:3838-4557(+)